MEKFLHKLKIENKLELTEESEEVCKSYLIKSDNCLKSAKVLSIEGLFENSVAESYYAMYNCIIALLFKCGIKCENHTAGIILLGKLFGLKEQQKTITNSKKERIDKQYYISEEKTTDVVAEEMIKEAEQFILEIKSEINKLNNQDITKIREMFQEL